MSNHTVSPPSGHASDASGTPPSVGTVLGTIAPNVNRKAFFAQNQAATDIQVVLDDGAGTTATIIVLAAGASAGKQGGYWDTTGFLHLGRIRICGTASSQYAAAELI